MRPIRPAMSGTRLGRRRLPGGQVRARFSTYHHYPRPAKHLRQANRISGRMDYLMNDLPARRARRGWTSWIATAVLLMSVPALADGPSIVRVVKNADGFELTRDGKPYVIKGRPGVTFFLDDVGFD